MQQRRVLVQQQAQPATTTPDRQRGAHALLPANGLNLESTPARGTASHPAVLVLRPAGGAVAGLLDRLLRRDQMLEVAANGDAWPRGPLPPRRRRDRVAAIPRLHA